jgi:MFS family permease
LTSDDGRLWNRSIVALLICVFCSAAAALVGVTALGKQVYDLTHRELDLGLLGLAEFAPSALLVLVTGAVADRFNRARVSSISAAVEAASGVGLAFYAASRPTSVVPIFGLVLVFGAARAFLAPSNRALPSDIVPPGRLPWLTARRAAAWQIAIIFGPVLAGFLYAVDPVLPYVAMAALLGIASASMLFVDVPAREPAKDVTDTFEPSVEPEASAPSARGRLRDAFEGLRFIRRSPILFAAISLDLFAVLFGGAVALLPAIAEDRLGVGSVGLGWLRAAGGIGAAVVTLAIARRPMTRHVGRTLLVVVAIFGVGTIFLGVTRSFAIAFIAMAVLSGADSVSVYIRSTLVPLATPPDKRGRVLAVESVFIGASNELGAFESGVAGQLLGASGAVVLGGAATLVIAGTYWAAFPVLRDVDRFPQAASGSAAPR